MLIFIIFFILILAIIYCIFSYYHTQQKEENMHKSTADILYSLPQNKYIVLKNITIKWHRTTYRISYIIVSIYGIFLIFSYESGGSIFGSEMEQNWRNTVKGKAYEFPNPVMLTNKWIMAITNTTRIKKSLFIPVIVFGNNADVWATTQFPIIHNYELYDYITDYREAVLSKNDTIQIANLIYDEHEKSTTPKVTPKKPATKKKTTQKTAQNKTSSSKTNSKTTTTKKSK